jgi:hypothetical protein
VLQANFPCVETEHKNAPLFVEVSEKSGVFDGRLLVLMLCASVLSGLSADGPGMQSN